MRTNTRFLISAGTCTAAAVLAVAVGCSKLGDLGSLAGGNTGGSGTDPTAFLNAGQKIYESQRELAPMEEYAYGKAACAFVFANPKSRLDRNEALTQYVAEIGETLAMVSDQPEQYKGWHFGVLDSDDVNAFSAPGGFVCVTKGAIRLCENEDQLAAILAHEIAHIERGHPTQALKEAKLKAGVTEAVGEGVNQGVSSRFGSVPGAKEVTGVVTGYFADQVQNGFGQKKEQVADARGIDLLVRAGYNPHAMVAVFRAMKPSEKSGLEKFTVSTHYQPGRRADDAAKWIKRYEDEGWKFEDSPARQARFASNKKL